MWLSVVCSYLFTLLFLKTVSGGPFPLPQNAGLGVPIQLPARCKNIPGSAGWPPEDDWARLNTAVGGRLLKPAAPAAACHRNVPSKGAPSCDAVNAGWYTHEFHVSHPTSTIWQNWNNNSCLPGAGSRCSTDGYPVYVVAAREWGDVKNAVDFARTRNVRLNIKATGHDFLGRSVQPYSLSIWTHNLKGLKWYDSSFTPKGCRAPINGPAVTMAAGNTWGDVYASAKTKGLSVVGGYYDSVGIAGYLSNGGHGELSAKYGYGADMVLEIELVTSDGQIITANECQNQDFFWAMRGGGGSTYGVALSYTVQAIRSGTLAKFTSTMTGWEEVYHVHTKWAMLANAGAGGYISGHPGRGGTIALTVYLPNSTSVHLSGLVRPVLIGGRVLKARSCKVNLDGEHEYGEKEDDGPYNGTFYDYPSWEVARPFLADQAAAKPAVGTGENKIIASWLWSAKDLTNPKLRTALRGAFDGETQMMTDATMGVGTQNPPYIRGGGNAINPAMRTAVMRPAAELHWIGGDPKKAEAIQRNALKFTQSLRSLNPDGGTYPNEAFQDTPNWQHAFWGSNYPRLLEIKQRVDPKGVFYCRNCVGSEFYEDNKGILCRKEDQ